MRISECPGSPMVRAPEKVFSAFGHVSGHQRRPSPQSRYRLQTLYHGSQFLDSQCRKRHFAKAGTVKRAYLFDHHVAPATGFEANAQGSKSLGSWVVNGATSTVARFVERKVSYS